MVTMHKLFTLFVGLFLFFNLQAQYILTSSDVEFSNGEITDYLNSIEKDIIIPDNFNGVGVTTIGEQSFMGKQLTSVTIPNSVTSIRGGAFRENELTSVTIPNSVTSIEHLAFHTNKLTSVTIPSSITFIHLEAFAKNELTSITLPNSITDILYQAFDDNNLSSVTIPSSVTRIDDYAFTENDLTSFSLPYHHKGYSYSWKSRSTYFNTGIFTYQSGDVVSDLTAYYVLDIKGDAVDFGLTYNLDGGSTTNPISYTVEDANIILSDATKAGYVFQGWFTEAGFINEITEIKTGSTGDMELFAKFTEELITSVFEVNESTFSFYPNPSSDFIHTDVSMLKLTILNSQGVIVNKFESTNNTFNISDLGMGLYILQATGMDGLSYRAALIKE